MTGIRRAAVFSISVLAGVATAADRPFLMGKTPVGISTTAFPTWLFENLEDQDLISLHGDDFLGVPWDAFAAGAPPPSAWVAQWTSIADRAKASGKIRYLALSPLDSRKSLAPNVNAAGVKQFGWAPVDADGCYPFSTDTNAALYRQAYINHARYLIDLVRPRYFSPAVELDIQFYNCPTQKAAYIQWYTEVHRALKASHPGLAIFPTFQFEYMYGVALSTGDPRTSWCGGPRTDASLRACFQSRLSEALTIPGDRIAFSMYPLFFNFPPNPPDTYTVGVPWDDAFTMVKRSTDRRIWVAETGWSAEPVLTSYQHAAPPSSCGSLLIDTTIIGGEANLDRYMGELLAAAQDKEFEAVVWWENRDLLDGDDAARCPCPTGTDTCVVLENFYQAAGTFAELNLRRFGNMGLRRYDGSPRGARGLWAAALARPLATAASLESARAYPNPARAGAGGMTFTGLPAGAALRLHALDGRLLNVFQADFTGRAEWDGLDVDGRTVAPGVYFVRAEKDGVRKTLRIAVER